MVLSPKIQTCFICQSCGHRYSKWVGKCLACNEWNSVVEELVIPKKNTPVSIPVINYLSSTEIPLIRTTSTYDELDRVLGGGLVKGSIVLFGGEPGIGKSTLLLQIAASFGEKALYVSGEESAGQIKLRAERLKIADSQLKLLNSSTIEEVTSLLEAYPEITLIIIDSIQTITTNQIASPAGTISQVKACSQLLIDYAKKTGLTVLLIGHVTKEGQIAGPKVLEHMVDTVLYFESENNSQFRVIRSVKNRFGATHEIGVFEMTENGLQGVVNPSSLFINSAYHNNVSGSAVFAGVEGTRPMLIEIQALVVKSNMVNPRRAVVGWDVNRLAMIMAVLSARCSFYFGDKEVYLNVAGGLKITEPAADLAASLALISAFYNKPLPAATVIFGEVALSGEIRKVGLMESRLKEAEKLGFEQAIIPFNVNCISKLLYINLKKIAEAKSIF